LIAEDHTLVRIGIRALLEDFDGVEVAGEAGDGREALRLIQMHQPDVVLMDLTMPEMNGLEATSRAAREFPNVRVLILSAHADQEYVWQALQAGARGYVLKDDSPQELELAIKTVARGESYLSPAVSSNAQRLDREPSSLKRLTPRQREVLQLVAEGYKTKEIAQKLQISIKTVETHRARLMEQLNIYDIAGLVRYAIRMGLVTPDS